MAVQACILRLAVLKCYRPTTDLIAARGDLDRWFWSIFSNAVGRRFKEKGQIVKLQVTGYDCIAGEYPDPKFFDAIIISGSSSGAYERLPWITRLEAFIFEVYRQNTSVKLFGSCFGHQILCQTLLREHGVFVEQSPRGWENGVQTVNMRSEFVRIFPQCLNSSQKETRKLRVQFVHSDQVVIPKGVSIPGWIMMGRSDLCDVQGVYNPNRVLTFQGHAEYDVDINRANMLLLAKTFHWPEAYLNNMIALVEQDDDSGVFADIALEFFLGENA